MPDPIAIRRVIKMGLFCETLLRCFNVYFFCSLGLIGGSYENGADFFRLKTQKTQRVFM